MRGPGALLVGDESLVVSEGDGRGDDTQVVNEADAVLVGAGDREGDDATVAADELPRCAGVVLVVNEAGVADVGDSRVGCEELGDDLGVPTRRSTAGLRP